MFSKSKSALCMFVVSSFFLLVNTLMRPSDAHAGGVEIGKLNWALNPFCDVMELQVIIFGNMVSFHGIDDNCGEGSDIGILTGGGAMGPDGQIRLGIAYNAVPFTFNLYAVIDSVTLSGTWTDDFGNYGTFDFLGTGELSKTPREGKSYLQNNKRKKTKPKTRK